MSRITEIFAYLNNGCSISEANGCATGTGLTAVYDNIFNCNKSVDKIKMFKDLVEFYYDKKNILNIWNMLNDCERDFITHFVQYGGKEHLPTTLECAKKYHLSLEYDTKFGRKRSIVDGYEYTHLKFLHLLTQQDPKTKTLLLFPSGKDMPHFVFEVLQTVIEPIKIEYTEYTPTKAERIICRENRLGDFASVARVASIEQLKAREGTWDVSKWHLVKLVEKIGFEEVCDRDGKFCVPREARRNNDFKVASLLFILAANSKIVDIDYTGNVAPGKHLSKLLTMPRHEFAKKLFNDYARENRIYELHYLPFIMGYSGEQWIKWCECRKIVFDMLKKCPVGTFIKFKDFDKYTKVFHNNKFMQLLNFNHLSRGYNFGYDYSKNYDASCDEYGTQIISIILSFLSIIGMVDLAYTQNVPRRNFWGELLCVGITGFRITKLGAWILDITKDYQSSTIENTQNAIAGELIVLPDYTIIITGIICRIEHEPYLNQFLTKVSSDENAAVYKLDFKSATRAYDIKITPMKIQEYLKNASSKTLPDNVSRTLTDWQTKVGRIKIHEIIVIETDDELLIEEIKHIKAMKTHIKSDLHNAVAIFKDNKKKTKTLIEKNGWLVDT